MIFSNWVVLGPIYGELVPDRVISFHVNIIVVVSETADDDDLYALSSFRWRVAAELGRGALHTYGVAAVAAIKLESAAATYIMSLRRWRRCGPARPARVPTGCAPFSPILFFLFLLFLCSIFVRVAAVSAAVTLTKAGKVSIRSSGTTAWTKSKQKRGTSMSKQGH